MRVDDRQRRSDEPGDAQHRDVLLAVDDERPCGVPPASISDAPSTTCAAVTTMCGRATQPEPSTPSPQAVAVMRTTLGRTSSHRRRGERPGVGRRRRRRRPGDRRERVDARERAQDGARRHDRVQLLEDQRAANLVAHLRLAGQLQEDGARDPDEGEPERSAGDQAADRVEQRAAAGSPTGSRARTSRRREATLCSSAAPTSAPASAGERRVRRARAVVQEVRREPRADHRAGDEAARARAPSRSGRA